jgi:diaminohydroxyphosphoribosylaminopyrimidine deaminase/5-amino-6-(5-phosphoribosylamino)uracil reductase
VTVRMEGGGLAPLLRGRAPAGRGGRMDAGRLMREAIALAATTRPHPNPRVGALVVDAAGSVVGRGAHEGPGTAHAEVVAMRQAGGQAIGGTLVVSLEPCDHTGRTPPCAAAVIDSGVRRVVVGVEDPDPRVAGRGIARLRSAGIEVVVGVEAMAALGLDPGYFHHRRTGRPRVTLKAALTLDGQVAAADGSSQWITSEEARLDGHRLRADADAVMIGAGTLRSDDPVLTARFAGYSGRQPRPVIVAGTRPLPSAAAIWSRNPLVFAPVGGDWPGEVVVMPGPQGVDLTALLLELGGRQVVDLLVEGGPTLAGALLRDGLVDRGVFYLAGSLGGGIGLPVFKGAFATVGAARPVEISSVGRVGRDLRVEFVIKEC